MIDGRARNILAEHGGKAVVVAIPFVIALTNRSWLGNPSGDVDVWLYNGYYRALRIFAANREAWGPAEYFETRLPILVPGALVYGLFPAPVARIVLNLGLLHGAIALSFWNVVRNHLSAAAATAATALLVSDIFYLRTVGWDYIDNAVLAYQALTLALLTTRDGARMSPLRTALAGFTATSMLAVNVGSAAMLALLGIYRLVVVRRPASRGDVGREFARLFGWGALGGVGCLAVWGAISVLVLDGPFLFWREQLNGMRGIHPAEYSLPLGYAARGAHWLTSHATALLAGIVALAIGRWRPELRTRLVRFGCVACPVIYGLMILGEGAQRTFFLARSGVYASHYLLLTYLTLAAILFVRRAPPPWIVAGVALAFPAVAIWKLSLSNGFAFAGRHPAPMYAVAVSGALAVVVAIAVRRASALALALGALAGTTAFVPWLFQPADVADVRDYILDGGAPPRVYYAESDPQRLAMISAASALTDHVVHDHYDTAHRKIAVGDHVSVLHSALQGDPPDACAVTGLRFAGTRRFRQRYFDLCVHRFEAEAPVADAAVTCGSSPALDPRFAPVLALDAAALAPGYTGDRDGDAIVATEGVSSAKTLTETPLSLDAGTYRLTFRFASERGGGPAHRYEITVVDGGDLRWVAAAELPDTGDAPGSFAIAFTLARRIESLAVRVAFGGRGRLALHGLTVDRAR